MQCILVPVVNISIIDLNFYEAAFISRFLFFYIFIDPVLPGK